ncbi:serine/threonine-protein kinase ULK1a isoform X1 [Tachysurus ichikawai]
MCRFILCSSSVGAIPETPDQSEPQCSRTGLQDAHVRPHSQVFPLFYDVGAVETTPRNRSPGRSPDAIVHRWELDRRSSLPSTLVHTRTMPDLQERCVTHTDTTQRRRGSVKRCSSAGRLSDMLLKAVFGSQLDRGSCEGLNTERPMDTTAPPGGIVSVEKGSRSPGHFLFTIGTPPERHAPPSAPRPRTGNGTKPEHKVSLNANLCCD